VTPAGRARVDAGDCEKETEREREGGGNWMKGYQADGITGTKAGERERERELQLSLGNPSGTRLNYGPAMTRAFSSRDCKQAV